MIYDGVCKYCGRGTDRTDQYDELECESCAQFFDSNPTPPVLAPTQTLVNLETGDVVVKPKKQELTDH